MVELPQAPVLVGQLQDRGIDQERTVVGDDQDDAGAVSVPGGRGEYLHHVLPGGAGASGRQLRLCQGGQFDRVDALQIRLRDRRQKGLQQPPQFGGGLPAGSDQQLLAQTGGRT